MSSLVMAVNQFRIFPKPKSKIWWTCLVVLIALVSLLVSAETYAWLSFGGYQSSPLVESADGNSNLLISRGQVGELDVVTSGVVTATGATNIYLDGAGSHATLNGNVVSMRGFDTATVNFEWGYSTSYGSSTPLQNVVATGAFSANIVHFDPSKTIYYRSVIRADGTNYSGGTYFIASDLVSVGFDLTTIVVPLVYSIMILLVVLLVGSKSTIGAIIVAVVGAYIGWAFLGGIQSAINSLF